MKSIRNIVMATGLVVANCFFSGCKDDNINENMYNLWMHTLDTNAVLRSKARHNTLCVERQCDNYTNTVLCWDLLSNYRTAAASVRNLPQNMKDSTSKNRKELKEYIFQYCFLDEKNNF